MQKLCKYLLGGPHPAATATSALCFSLFTIKRSLKQKMTHRCVFVCITSVKQYSMLADFQSLFFPTGLSSRQLCPYKRSIPLHCAAPAHPHKVHSNVPPWSSSPPPYLRQGIPANAWGRAVCVYLIRDSLAHSTRPPTKIRNITITIMAVIITRSNYLQSSVCFPNCGLPGTFHQPPLHWWVAGKDLPTGTSL